MFIYHGIKTATLKKYTNHHQACKNCKAYDLDVKIVRDYYQIFHIPVFPFGEKTLKVQCNRCKEFVSSEAITRDFENTRTPFYLYSVLILITGLIALMVFMNLRNQKEKTLFAADPKVGDVYRIRDNVNNKTTYFFLRLTRINADTIFAFHSNLVYDGYHSKLDKDDFFVQEDEIHFLKMALKQMIENHEIVSIERNYDDYEGYNRIK